MCLVPFPQCQLARYGPGRWKAAESGQMHLVLKTYIPGKALLAKLNRTAGVIRDSVPSRCGFPSRYGLRSADAYLNGSRGILRVCSPSLRF